MGAEQRVRKEWCGEREEQSDGVGALSFCKEHAGCGHTRQCPASITSGEREKTGVVSVSRSTRWGVYPKPSYGYGISVPVPVMWSQKNFTGRDGVYTAVYGSFMGLDLRWNAMCFAPAKGSAGVEPAGEVE
jgi:hypothetical protein